MWALKMNNVKFDFVRTIPPKQTRTAEFRKLNPNGSVPVLVDGDIVIWESGAILTYLADKYGWEDLYPKNIGDRAQVDNWLHWHHRNSREVQIGYGMPIMRPDLKESGLWSKVSELSGRNAIRLLNKVLKDQDYLALGRLTLADIQVCQDIIQCRKKYMDIFDFSDYPHVEAWMDRLENGPCGGWLENKLTKIGQWVQTLKAKRSKL